MRSAFFGLVFMLVSCSSGQRGKAHPHYSLWRTIVRLPKLWGMSNSLPPPDEAALRKMFATAIVQCRAEWQWSQEELAERAGLSTTYISLLERCRRNLTVLVAAQIAAAFEMPLSALVNMAESHAA